MEMAGTLRCLLFDLIAATGFMMLKLSTIGFSLPACRIINNLWQQHSPLLHFSLQLIQTELIPSSTMQLDRYLHVREVLLGRNT